MDTEKVPLISVEKLQVEFEGHKVFSNLSFEIFAADFICIVGPNGAGKSTLIKTLLGQIKPSKGEIIFTGLKQKFIGYMPQENKIDKNFPASVEEIVRSGTLNQIGFRPFYKKTKETFCGLIRRSEAESFISTGACCNEKNVDSGRTFE